MFSNTPYGPDARRGSVSGSFFISGEICNAKNVNICPKNAP